MRIPARWIEIAAGVVILALIAVLAVVAQQGYTAEQREARAVAVASYRDVDALLADLAPQLEALQIAISNGEQVYAAVGTQTLSEKPRLQMRGILDYAMATLAEQQQQETELTAALSAARAHLESTTAQPQLIREDLAHVVGRELPSASATAHLVESIGKRITELQDAHVQWQAEQARIAAEKAAAEAAARLAKARTISSSGTLTNSGGSTAPSAPSPPPAVVASTLPAVISVSVENYVAALAPNSYIAWVPNLCNGYYVCGRTWVGGSNTTPTRIELDPVLRDIYANRIGVSVLVHEAAHSRQWYTYGSNIIISSEAFTVAQGITGKAAVEYMADCATIGYLGYSTGAYTSTCTPEQIAGIAEIW